MTQGQPGKFALALYLTAPAAKCRKTGFDINLTALGRMPGAVFSR